MKKLKFVSTLASIALCMAVMVFGVMAANQVTFSVTSTISYTVQDVFVELETRVYSTNKLFSGDSDLSGSAGAIKSALSGNNFDALDSYNIDSTYALTPVDLGQSGATNPYAHTFRSKTPNDTPSDLGLNLEYSVANGGVYAYFVVIKVTNISSIPLYSFVRTSEQYPSDQNVYTPPTVNNLSYMQQSYVTLSGKDSFDYIVFAIALEDIRENVPTTEFKFPIEVTKDKPTNIAEPATLTINPTGTNFVDETILVTNSGITITPEVYDATAYDFGYASLLNFVYSGDDSNDLVITLTSQNYFVPGFLCKNNYFDIGSVLFNVSQDSSIILLPYTQSPETKLTITLPKENIIDGECRFFVALAKTNQTLDLVDYTLSTENQGVSYILSQTTSAVGGTQLEEGVSGNISFPAMVSLGSTYFGLNQFTLNNIDTSRQYVKLTSSFSADDIDALENYSDDGIVLYSEEFLRYIALGNGYTLETARYATALLTLLSDGCSDYGQGYYANGYYDEDGLFSWIIPTLYLDDLFNFEIAMAVPSDSAVSCSLSFEYVDELETKFEYILEQNPDTGKEYYTWCGYIWNGFSYFDDYNIEIPSEYNGIPVTHILCKSPINYMTINTLVIPSSIVAIDGEMIDLEAMVARPDARLGHLVVECDPMVLKAEHTKETGDVPYTRITVFTFTNYNGELPTAFISKCANGEAVKIYLPTQEDVEDASAKYGYTFKVIQ